MSILTILLIVMVAWIIYHLTRYSTSDNEDKVHTLRKLKTGRSIGLFAMITGILGQLIGLYMAFNTIEQVGDVSPALLFQGFKVSMVCTIYGILIYLLSILLWFVTSSIVDKR